MEDECPLEPGAWSPLVPPASPSPSPVQRHVFHPAGPAVGRYTVGRRPKLGHASVSRVAK